MSAPDSFAPNLDAWMPRPMVRVFHRRQSAAAAEMLWDAARGVRLRDTAVLGRLVRWRIPGVPGDATFDRLFREAPFTVLEESGLALISGIVGRIWTLRRDYPGLANPEDFRSWSQPGTARVLFANWVQSGLGGISLLNSEARVEPIGAQGRIGVASVRPLIRAFAPLIGTEALRVAVRRAENQRLDENRQGDPWTSDQ
jgi:hypothetical protein